MIQKKFMYRFISVLIFWGFVSIQNDFAQSTCDGPLQLDSVLIAYYSFNGNANDESSNGYNAVVNGATLTTDRFGNSDSAYLFDGNDAIVPSSGIAFDTAISIALWIYKSVADAPFGFIGKWNTSPGNNNSFLVYNGEGVNLDKPKLIVQFTDDTYIPSSNMPDEIPINEWHHICMTWSSSNGKYCAYLDGQKVVEQNIVSTIGKSINNEIVGYALQIGNWGNTTTPPYSFVGKIDEVYMSGRALNCNEVDSLYYQGCIRNNILDNQMVDQDTTIYARDVIQLQNVVVNPPYQLTLQAQELLIENDFEVSATSKLNVINQKGCDRE